MDCELEPLPTYTIHSEPDFDVSITIQEPETGAFMPFVHLDVYYWAPSTLRKLIALHKTLRPTLSNILYCHGTVDDEKFDRFVTRFGWQVLSSAPCTDGKTRRIYVHYKNTNEDQLNGTRTE